LAAAEDGTRAGGDLGFRRTASIVWPLLATPVAVIAGIVAVQYTSDTVESFYADDALPWIITYWIGLGFTTTWRLLSESARARNAPRGVIAAVGVLSAFVLLSMLGGVSVFWDDPWIFGVAIAPGLALARPLVQALPRGRRAEADAGVERPY
jgi:hypothetical protein